MFAWKVVVSQHVGIHSPELLFAFSNVYWCSYSPVQCRSPHVLTNPYVCLSQVPDQSSSLTGVDSGLLSALEPSQTTLSLFLSSPDSEAVAGTGVILPYSGSGNCQEVLATPTCMLPLWFPREAETRKLDLLSNESRFLLKPKWQKFHNNSVGDLDTDLELVQTNTCTDSPPQLSGFIIQVPRSHTRMTGCL